MYIHSHSKFTHISTISLLFSSSREDRSTEHPTDAISSVGLLLGADVEVPILSEVRSPRVFDDEGILALVLGVANCCDGVIESISAEEAIADDTIMVELEREGLSINPNQHRLAGQSSFQGIGILRLHLLVAIVLNHNLGFIIDAFPGLSKERVVSLLHDTILSSVLQGIV
jgi:hypothetical protein